MGLVALAIAAFLVPAHPTVEARSPSGGAAESVVWQPFDPVRIPAVVAGGGIVWVNVTADWCLTCKVNERVALDTESVWTAVMGPDVCARIIAVVEKPSSKVRARRSRETVGRHTELGREETTEVPGRDAEPVPELAFRPPVQRAVENQLNRAAHELRTGLQNVLRRPVGPAAHARPVTRGLRSRGQRELPHVLGVRLRRTSRPAVDACGLDRCDEASVESAVAALRGPVTLFVVENHQTIVAWSDIVD